MGRAFPIDEAYVRRAVSDLRRAGFPASEGYYLVVLSPEEGEELRRRLRDRKVVPIALHRHPPRMLEETIRLMRFRPLMTLGEAVVCVADHSRNAGSRPSSGRFA